MALRDWLDPDYNPLEVKKSAELAEISKDSQTLAPISTSLAKSANLQVIDNKKNNLNISTISRISISKPFKMTALEAENFTECQLERVAIMQECAGLPEREALARAEVICLAEWHRGRT